MAEVKATNEVKVLAEINSTYSALVEGFRTTLLAARDFGKALIRAQKEQGIKGNGKFFAWLKGKTKIKLSDAALGGYMRVADKWKQLEKAHLDDGLQEMTLKAALRTLKGKPRRSKGRGKGRAALALKPEGTERGEGEGSPDVDARTGLTAILKYCKAVSTCEIAQKDRPQLLALCNEAAVFLADLQKQLS